METLVLRNLRRAMAGLVVTLLVYAGLFAASAREEESLVEAGWTSSAADRLRPYGTAAAERGTAFVHEVAQALNWILALAPLPLAVLSLLWLARRNQRVPGVRADWYVLMAPAVVATTSKTWPRATVLLIAVLAAVTGASTGRDLWLAALSAVVVPVLAWYVAGHLPYEKGKHARGAADAQPAAPTPLREAG
ncbi:hypothetical protein PV755_28300 [Streptomyces caniscabiei]|uniref:Uncharacterized protein n=1 Tax=Streptomyces caniscabiei TaxID=2746961 RepID=A0A927L8B4_9ACTN|nr:hypothetical protein [Streptomyces caniscabiei]MBD9727345.1 hypothetical protein [Streptomyces caniscabiei]MDX3512776.1 hypothetical protein [Streptomyces caniscabiei]MDX3722301.1 hypothetical protein [Streptomyces caniscabiei]MDX3733402.1 hypothetical protein [Streptomyces caniscabiei]WEO28722.1 hypothetical protein IHE65_39195 [Streptomyces caniscabiei]